MIEPVALENFVILDLPFHQDERIGAVLELKERLRQPDISVSAKFRTLLEAYQLEQAYGGNVDPRAAARTKQDAEAQVRSILAQLEGGADFDVLMKQFSEDRGSASNPDGYDVSPDAQLVLDFRRLGLRLDVGEVGVVESEFGFHVMKRIE